MRTVGTKSQKSKAPAPDSGKHAIPPENPEDGGRGCRQHSCMPKPKTPQDFQRLLGEIAYGCFEGNEGATFAIRAMSTVAHDLRMLATAAGSGDWDSGEIVRGLIIAYNRLETAIELEVHFSRFGNERPTVWEDLEKSRRPVEDGIAGGPTS